MNAINQPPLSIENAILNLEQLEIVQHACDLIAPAWPLDQMIAVNPWWKMTDQPLPDVSAKLAALNGSHCLMPRAYFLDQWQQGKILSEHLQRALKEADLNTVSEDTLLQHLNSQENLQHGLNISDLIDQTRDLTRGISWRNEITHQISQFCAAYFTKPHLTAEAHTSLYPAWLELVRYDRGISILMETPQLTQEFDKLPADPYVLITQAIQELEIADERLGDYCHGLLLSINGWASWMAYLRWQSKLNHQDNTHVLELLAIRMAWELSLWRYYQNDGLLSQWQDQKQHLPLWIEKHQKSQKLDWVWQRATEMAYQQSVSRLLQSSQPKSFDSTRAPLQAAFCIDVRSEVMRRALEKQHPKIQTIGFAGFFGLPIEYSPAGTTYSRPQLPGLLKPTIQARESDNPELAERRAFQLNIQARWQEFSQAAPSSFSYVEMTGLFYLFKLVKNSFRGSPNHHPVNKLFQQDDATEFTLFQNQKALSKTELAEMVSGILNAMSLTQNFAPCVLLVGHGSSTCNNPHAAGLDCGACGGQTGEVNVRILAQLLNDAEIRDALHQHEIIIPDDTQFIAALHNTTTDEIKLLNAHGELNSLNQVQKWLQAATQEAQAERAPKLGISTQHPQQIRKAIEQRSRDWSQTRPEWGLAGNACFIVAPRDWTRNLIFQGRSFLHDYDWQQDNRFKTLELIMTAPMIVTHWINFQYYASTTDNTHYGSGNKILHNVVGDNLGIFEGNGGDLRIGLPLQSLHDGHQWMHEPLRLSVYIHAPQHAITDIVKRHPQVRQLIDNQWLYLFQMPDGGEEPSRLFNMKWETN